MTTACGLALGTVFPFFTASGSGTTTTSPVPAAPGQQLILNKVTSDPGFGALDALGAVEVTEIAPAQISNEQGLIDPALLEDSSVRYPFDGKMRLTDPFGYRTAPVEQFHDAQDIAAPAGTPIRAIASGVVLEAGFSTDGCGFGLKLQHRVDNQTLTSRYCHMQASSHGYRVGDAVVIGDPAGRVGNTGMSFGNHLHLALRLNGEPIDPMPYLAKNSSN